VTCIHQYFLQEIRDYEEFNDAGRIAEYAAEAVERTYKAAIVNGKDGNVFDPTGSATRAEFAAMLQRFLG